MKKGVTLVELLVAMAIGLILLSSVYSFYITFLRQSSKERIKAQTMSEIREAFRILEDDIRHSGFGYPKTGCNGKGICQFYVDSNCDVGDETFCKKGSDRFFVSDGWQIIKDFTDDGQPDGNISDAVYEQIVNQSFYAKVTSYVQGATFINVDRVDIDNDPSHTQDIKPEKAIIVCGRKNNNGVTQEGRRIESVSGIFTYKLLFHSKEQALKGKYDCSASNKGLVLPANVWYVRKASDGKYWLCRNHDKVLSNVEDFQVHVGYDLNGDGVVEDSEWINADSLPDNAEPSRLKFFWFEIKVAYYWRNKKYQVNYTMRVDAFH